MLHHLLRRQVSVFTLRLVCLRKRSGESFSAKCLEEENRYITVDKVKVMFDGDDYSAIYQNSPRKLTARLGGGSEIATRCNESHKKSLKNT